MDYSERRAWPQCKGQKYPGSLVKGAEPKQIPTYSAQDPPAGLRNAYPRVGLERALLRSEADMDFSGAYVRRD